MLNETEIVRGVKTYTSRGGFRVISIHYSADPDKDPATHAGAAWFKRETSSIVGGIQSAQWRSEMELDWEATGGDLVFPQFGAYRSKIVVPPLSQIPSSWRLYGSFDYGHRNPSAFYVHAIDHDGDVWTVWEYYQAGDGYRDTARAIRACPYFGLLCTLPVADPSLFADTQQQTNDVKSIARLFYELDEKERILFARGKAGPGCDVTFAEKINGEFWKDLEHRAPRWRIFATCPKLIWELEKIRFAEWSSSMQEVKNLREQIVDRDNHGFDSCKYFFMQFFGTPRRAEEDEMRELAKSDPLAYKEWVRVRDMFKPKPAAIFGSN